MKHLTRHDYASVLELLRALEQRASDGQAFAATVLDAVRALVPAEVGRMAVSDTADESNPVLEGGHIATMALGGTAHVRLTLVLERSHAIFSARERERLALMQPHLAFLFARAGYPMPGPHGGRGDSVAQPLAQAPRLPEGAAPVTPLTPREVDVMQWLACGKTDADIAALLAISPRTVHKHLEHIYDKLGVETRTAAVMRLRTLPRPS